MAILSFISIPALLVSLTVAYVVVRLAEHVRTTRKAARLGCKPVAAGFRSGGWGLKDRIGVTLLRKSLLAQRQKRFPVLFFDEFTRLSAQHHRPVSTMLTTGMPFRRMLLTCEPRNIQTALATSFRDFAIGDMRIGNFRPLLGEGIFASNGKRWEHSRAMLRPQFARSQISDVSLEETHVQSLMDVLDAKVVGGGWTELVDLLPLFFRLTLDSATEFLFGESVQSQKRVEGQAVDVTTEKAAAAIAFATAFDASQSCMSVAGRYGALYWLKHNREFIKNVRICHEFIDSFARKAVAKQQQRIHGTSSAEKSGEGEKKDRFVFLEALAEETSDTTEMRYQMLNILLAGRDTTASAIGWFFVTMARPENQSIYKRLREDVLAAFGTYREPRDITFESLKALPYLQWCLNELLRLYPIVPQNARMAVHDTVLPLGGGEDGQSPIFVKKGDEVAFSIYSMHRRTDLWGPDADQFRPERWEKRRVGWDYLPFNGGPRICIGQQFALTEIAYVVVRMMQRVDELDGSAVPRGVAYKQSLTNTPGNGVPLRLHFVD